MKSLMYGVLLMLSFVAFDGHAKKVNPFNYYGVALQNNSYDAIEFTPTFDPAALAPLSFIKKTSGQGIRAFVGHHFNQYAAVEGGLSSLGKAKFLVANKQTDAAGKITSTTVHQGDFSTLAADIRGVFTYSLSSKIFLKAHLGALVWDSKLESLAGTSDAPTISKSSDSGISLLSGVGLGYGFNKKVAMSVDYEQSEVFNITTKTLGVSLSIRF
jgi:hypothetical protein